jgi:hypothetical protein
MKYTLALLLAVTSSWSFAAGKLDAELDRAVRLQNLTVVALINNDYELACKAQTQVVDALNKSYTASPDLVVSARLAQREFCTTTLDKLLAIK